MLKIGLRQTQENVGCRQRQALCDGLGVYCVVVFSCSGACANPQQRDAKEDAEVSIRPFHVTKPTCLSHREEEVLSISNNYFEVIVLSSSHSPCHMHGLSTEKMC
jgi:hypothetical protein